MWIALKTEGETDPPPLAYSVIEWKLVYYG